MSRQPNRPGNRINRVGDVVPERRTLTTAYYLPDESGYKKGDRLIAPHHSSPARQAHPSRTGGKRLAKAQAVEAMARMARAAREAADAGHDLAEVTLAISENDRVRAEIAKLRDEFGGVE